jgi:hypothetical protein
MRYIGWFFWHFSPQKPGSFRIFITRYDLSIDGNIVVSDSGNINERLRSRAFGALLRSAQGDGAFSEGGKFA